MANPEHVKHLLKGADHWNQWRSEQPDHFRPDFVGNEFDINTTFSCARLDHAQFNGARLEGVVFRGARLEGANFSLAKLVGVDFMLARLENAEFAGANLDGTSLQGARLSGANFFGASLESTDLIHATGLVPDASWTRNAQFDASSDWQHSVARWLTHWLDFKKQTRHSSHIDPWSRLRTIYSGPKFL